MSVDEMTPRDAYEAGYGDGESSVSADWHFALTEVPGIPDDVPAYPVAFSQWLIENWEPKLGTTEEQ